MSILPKTGNNNPELIAQNKTLKNMNEIIIKSYDFKRWLRCQIMIKLSANIWITDSGRMVELIDLVPRYLEDTNSANEWKKIHANLKGVGV
jgi:DNA polymerase IIIc chi subunit